MVSENRLDKEIDQSKTILKSIKIVYFSYFINTVKTICYTHQKYFIEKLLWYTSTSHV